MISLLITLLVLLLVFGVVWYVIDLLPIDVRFRIAARLIIGVILVLYLLRFLVPAYPLHGVL